MFAWFGLLWFCFGWVGLGWFNVILIWVDLGLVCCSYPVCSARSLDNVLTTQHLMGA